MSKFTTRVELHDTEDGTSEEYEVLHTAMEEAGFTRTITDSETGVKYQLPPAEYDYIGDKTREEVLTLASTAAAQTGKKYSIIVSPSPGRVWQNLPEAKRKLAIKR